MYYTSGKCGYFRNACFYRYFLEQLSEAFVEGEKGAVVLCVCGKPAVLFCTQPVQLCAGAERAVYLYDAWVGGEPDEKGSCDGSKWR